MSGLFLPVLPINSKLTMKKLFVSLLIGVSVLAPIKAQAQSASSATYTCEQSHASLAIILNGAVRYTDAMVRAYENNDQTAIGMIDFTLEYKVIPYLKELDRIIESPYYEGCSTKETEARTQSMSLYRRLMVNAKYLSNKGHNPDY